MIERQTILEHCIAFSQKRCEALRKELLSLEESQRNETKSTAGDKHDTAREMIGQEIERVGASLAKAEHMSHELSGLGLGEQALVVTKGSIVKTDKLLLLICCSLGKVMIAEQELHCISTGSPIGKILLGKQPGDSVKWNGQEQRIEAIA